MTTLTMHSKRFSPAGQSAFDARFDAQKIAFGPVVFQCVRIAWKQRHAATAWPRPARRGSTSRRSPRPDGGRAYALKVVLESCLSAGVVMRVDGRYVLDKAGYCLLADPITRINLDFIHDVCYLGLHRLEEALATGTPVGLEELGSWPTLYEGLSELPEPARTSWFAFDHHYSDTSFPDVMPDVLATAPEARDGHGRQHRQVRRGAAGGPSRGRGLRLVDLPQQLAVGARRVSAPPAMRGRAEFHAIDMLDPASRLPGRGRHHLDEPVPRAASANR